MDDQMRKDVTVAGNWALTGCKYNSVRVNGRGVFEGGLDCIELESQGAMDVTGDLVAVAAKIIGKTQVDGNMQLTELAVLGNLLNRGNISVVTFEVHGQCEVGGAIAAETVQVDGILKVRGACEAELFTSTGIFFIEGLLNSGIINIELTDQCRVQEIGGENIKVCGRQANTVPGGVAHDQPGERCTLIVDTIEGDNIYLEQTVAQVVRGNNITIGPDCRIESVEYRNIFAQDESAQVKDVQRVWHT